MNSGHGRDLEPMPKYLYLKDDGTNRSVGVSYDGIILQEFDARTRTDFMTPDQVYWGLRNDGTGKLAITLHSWREF